MRPSFEECLPQTPPDWVAPFYDLEDPAVYHTSRDCGVARAIPEQRRRLAVAAMRERLPGW